MCCEILHSEIIVENIILQETYCEIFKVNKVKIV